MRRGIQLVRLGLLWSRPLGTALIRSQRSAGAAPDLVVADLGDHQAAGRLCAELGARRGAVRPSDLLIAVASPHASNPELAQLVGDHRRAGGEALIVVSGAAVERRVIERELRSDRDVGIAVMIMVDALDGPGLARVRRRVASLVVARGEGLRAESPALRQDIVHRLHHRTALRLAVRSALVAEASEQTLTSAHARMAADTAGTVEAGVDPKDVGAVVAVGLLSVAWRHGARRLPEIVPLGRILLRGGLAYSFTRLVGLGAHRVALLGRAPHQEER